MTIQETLQAKMIDAMVERNNVRRDNIKFLIGQFQNKAKNKEKTLDDKEAIATIKSILKSVKEITIPNLGTEQSSRLDEANDFVELCEELLPKMATEGEVIDFLTTIDFKSLKSPMQAIGITVKHFNGNVNPELVRNCLPFLGIYV
ncbi:MAG: GatB/YqeY domain-containing protein [Bacilli bacterium]|nr:GatB/YqeY domain-containing protein [Bacilli bacterium]